MLTVACVCVPGGEYDASHVARLRDQVAANLKQPYDFHVIEKSDKPGWWAKIDLFEPGRFNGRVLYLDLDVTIVDNLGAFIEFGRGHCGLAAVDDYERLCLNSSIMCWQADECAHLYEDFTPEVMDNFYGDQDWITEQEPGAWTFPIDWVPSFKHDCTHRIMGPPEDAKVIVFHGKPRPWDLGRNHWAR